MQTHHTPLDLVRERSPERPVALVRPASLVVAARWFQDRFKDDVLYAVKANPSPWVIKALAKEGIRAFDACLAGLGGCPYAPGASGNIVTEDLVFMLESMGFETGIDLEALIAARRLLHESLPDEPLHGHLAIAGVPRIFRKA